MSSLADRGSHELEAAAAFARIYADTYQPLVSYCRGMTGNAVEAEEVAQAALVQAWASWHRYTPERPFWPWVTAIARNHMVDQQRRTARRRGWAERAAGEAKAEHYPLPDEIVEDEDDRQLALDALRQLRPRYQRLVALREIDGRSYEDIALSEGTSVEAVRGSLRRARLALRLAFSQMSTGASAVFGFAAFRRLRARLATIGHRAEVATPLSMATLTKAGEVVAAIVALAVVGSSTTVVPASPANEAAAPVIATGGGSSGAGRTTSSTSPTGSASGTRGRAMGGGATEQATGLPVVPPGGFVPDGVHEPEDADFVHVVASPRYEDDGVLYASGVARERCPLGCPVLFKSSDRGATWQRLDGRGFAGGLIMLPPSYPEDSRIFVISDVALAVSDDDGASFVNLTPLGGAAAMSPGFSTVDRTILVGAVPGWEYHDEIGKVTPLSFLPPPVGPVLTFAYAPDAADRRVFVGGTTTVAENRSASAVWLCNAGACAEPIALDGASGPPRIAVSPAFSADGVAFAWRDDRLYRTLDAGRSFTAVTLPASGAVAALAYDAVGRVYVAIDGVDHAGATGGLFVSTNHGSTWAPLGRDTALARGARAITALQDGRLLAAPSNQSGGGLLCSADGGRKWGPRCG